MKTAVKVVLPLCLLILIISSTASATPQPFQSLLGIESMQYKIYMPVVMRNYVPPVQISTRTFSCSNNPARGELYRTLVYSTELIFGQIYDWAESSCICGSNLATYQGQLFGKIIGKIIRIIITILSMIWSVVSRIVGMLLSLLALARGEAEPPEISCTGDMEMFCWGLAMVAALDDMAGGIVTTIVVLLVGIMSFYLIMFLIREVRRIMEPTSGGET